MDFVKYYTDDIIEAVSANLHKEEELVAARDRLQEEIDNLQERNRELLKIESSWVKPNRNRIDDYILEVRREKFKKYFRSRKELLVEIKSRLILDAPSNPIETLVKEYGFIKNKEDDRG